MNWELFCNVFSVVFAVLLGMFSAAVVIFIIGFAVLAIIGLILFIPDWISYRRKRQRK